MVRRVRRLRVRRLREGGGETQAEKKRTTSAQDLSSVHTFRVRWSHRSGPREREAGPTGGDPAGGRNPRRRPGRRPRREPGVRERGGRRGPAAAAQMAIPREGAENPAIFHWEAVARGLDGRMGGFPARRRRIRALNPGFRG